MSTQFPHLFAPLVVGGVELKNRIVVPPHGVAFPPGQGDGIERVIDYHVEKAKGGAGLIIMSTYAVPEIWREAGSWGGLLPVTAPGTLNVCTDPIALPAYQRLIAGVHAEGAHFFGQLNSGGRQGKGPGADAWQFPHWAPSALPCPETREIPKEMEVEDIAAFVEAYARGTTLMAEAGADGVELFAAQGYLLSEFLSPNTNKRTDTYGGILENRMRFIVEALAAIRLAVPDKTFVVGLRMNGADFTPGGFEIDESCSVARRLVSAGLADYLNISGRTYGQWPGWIADASHPPALFANLAAAIKDAVPGTPVCVVGRIGVPRLANNLIADGKTDLVGMARALISDPELPNKALRNDLKAIRHCTYGNQSCIMGLMKGKGVSCMHNPAVGRERYLGIGTMRRVDQPKRIVVVGGGPAGLAAAGSAAERGHQVTLFEKEIELGGQNRFTARMRTRRTYVEATRWQIERVERLGVDIRFATNVTSEAVLACAADAVIVATGSRPRRDGYSSHRPDVVALAGADLPHVHTIFEVFTRPDAIIGRVVIVDEDPHGAAVFVAEHLAESGHEVEIVTPAVHPGGDIELSFVPETYRRISAKGITITPNTLVNRIDATRIELKDRYTNQLRTVSSDTVVLAMGNQTEASLYFALKGRVEALHRIGDCLAPRQLDSAILDGERIGRTL